LLWLTLPEQFGIARSGDAQVGDIVGHACKSHPTPIPPSVVRSLRSPSIEPFVRPPIGFFPPPAGEKIENLLGLDSLPTNLLDPSKPPSADNLSFEASQRAPFAVDEKDGPSHFQLCERAPTIRAGLPISSPSGTADSNVAHGDPFL
jgi:hypothetical protein